MKAYLLEQMQNDFESLLKYGYMKNARALNEALGNEKFFGELRAPMYFNGTLSAPTVFVMLNPGASEDVSMIKDSDTRTAAELASSVFNHLEQYGVIDRDRMDNFDLKQAAFLYEFKDSGIDLPDFFEKDKQRMLRAKENVLMQKLQLELIPYFSREFVRLFDSLGQAMKNLEAIEGHLERVLDIIVGAERKYVLFGSKQYFNIFAALKLRNRRDIELGEEVAFQIGTMGKKLYFNTVSLMHKGRLIQGGIPYSFPRRDLPNAYDKMRKYGEMCYQEMNKRFNLMNSQ